MEAVGALGLVAYGLWQRIRAAKLLEKHNSATDALGDVLGFAKSLEGNGGEGIRLEVERLLRERGVIAEASVAASKNGGVSP
jgi:hypothetical protein